MEHNESDGLVDRWQRALVAAGFDGVSLLRGSGNEFAGLAVFGWGALALHLTSDRSQVFVDIGPSSDTSIQSRMDDIGVALGWTDVATVVSRESIPPLSDQLAEILLRRAQLEALFSPTGLREGLARIAVGHKAIGDAVLRHLAETAKRAQAERKR